ncbi:MAG: OsmC family peroxiredoxin [Betaproteobacteria bacterium]|nr:MAG: OsmC family peroxiredoxin [Betaproteobacteria bacterium]
MPEETMKFSVRLEQQQDFQFLVQFGLDDVPDLQVDEPKPLGSSAGPNAARLLAAAVGNCLAASLLFCLRKFKQTPGNVVAQVEGQLEREQRGRLRVARLDVVIHLGEAQGPVSRLAHCLREFEDYCVVTQSVRRGIEVNVRVEDADGRVVFDPKHPEEAGKPIGAQVELQHDPGFPD